MRSISSSRNLPQWMQGLLLLLCMGLCIIYLTEPARPVGLKEWLGDLRSAVGFGQPAHSVLLESGAESFAGAKPLIDYGNVQFLGCDLSLRDNRLYLVTHWWAQGGALPYSLVLRFVSPVSEVQRDVEQPIQESTLTPLPADFYLAGQRGKVWLRLIFSDSGQLVPLQDSLLVPGRDGWIRVCN
jgi:hypothetical protein